MYTNNAAISTNQNNDQGTNISIKNQETFTQKRLLLQQLFHTDQLLQKTPLRHKAVKSTKNSDENSESNLGNDYPNAEPIYANIPVVQNNTEPRGQNLELVTNTTSRNDQINNTGMDPNSDNNERIVQHVRKIEANAFEEKPKISLKSKYYQDNIYACDNAKQNPDNESQLSYDTFISTNRKYYQDNINSSQVNKLEDSNETVTHSKIKEVSFEGSKQKYYSDNIYTGVQRTNKNGNQTEAIVASTSQSVFTTHHKQSKEEYSQDSIHSSNSVEKSNSKTSESTKPKYYPDNIYAGVQRTNKNGNQTQSKADSNQENIYENVATTSQLSSTTHYTYSKEDNTNKRYNIRRLTSENEYFKEGPVEKNLTAIRAEKAISMLLKNREEIQFKEKFDREIGTEGSFDNFDGNVPNSILSLQSNESLDFELEEEEDPLRLLMQKDDFKNDRETLRSCENVTLDKLLNFMDKYKMFSWFHLMKMLQLNTMHSMDASQMKLQNEKFDLILAEWTYLKMMKMFDSHVVSKLVIVLSRNDFNKLFGYLDAVIKCSEHFLKDIEDCWQRNPMLPDFFNVICENLQSNFDCYVPFCGGQPIFELTLNGLISNPANRTFNDVLNTIHMDPKCQGLHLLGYLLKPYQKIRDFPSLIQNVMITLSTDDLEYDQCEEALNLLENLLRKCAKAEKEAKEKILVHEINEKLEFSKNMSIKTLTNLESRRFVHSGEVDLIEINTTFFKKQKQIVKPVHLFLFNDLLVITRKSSNTKYIVLTYCHRIYFEINTDTFLSSEIYESLINQDRILILTMQQNHKNCNTEMLFSFKTYTDKVRWMDALDPYESVIANVRANTNVSFQVIVKKNYKAQHTDEISLFLQNKIIVYRTYYDGWHFGQRISDKQFGWFPANYVSQSYLK